MLAYPTKKLMSSRMARKHERNKVFIKNKKEAKLRKKLKQESRRDLEGV